MATTAPSKKIANQKLMNDAPPKSVRPRRKKRSSRHGLIIVMSLLAVITGGLLFGFTSSSNVAKTTASLSPEDRKIFKNVSTHLEGFKEIFDSYPSSYGDLIELEWIASQPMDRHSNPITYQLDSTGASYVLRSVGEDKRMGTADDSCLRSVTSNKVSLHFFTCKL